MYIFSLKCLVLKHTILNVAFTQHSAFPLWQHLAALIWILKCCDTVLNVFSLPHHSPPDHPGERRAHSRWRINHFCLISKAASCQKSAAGIIALICLVSVAPLNAAPLWTLSHAF